MKLNAEQITKPSHLILRISALLLVVFSVIYVSIAAYFYANQDRMLFLNKPQIENANIEKLSIQDVRLKSPDGEMLQAFYERAKPGRPTIIFFHGQGGGLTLQKWRFYRLHKQGIGFLALAYRGYSESSGKPSEKGLYIDGLTAYDFLISQGIQAKQIIVHGHSMGSGIATYVAANRPIRALLLEAPFSSAADVAKERFNWLPIDILMKNKFENTKYIKKVKAPILIVHGGKDHVIPAKFGRRLYNIANGPKQFIFLPNSEHNTLVRDGLYQYFWKFLGIEQKDYAKDIVIVGE